IGTRAFLLPCGNPSKWRGRCVICLKPTRVLSASARVERERHTLFSVRATGALAFHLCPCNPPRFSRPLYQIFARYRVIVWRRHNLQQRRAAARRSLRFHLRRTPSLLQPRREYVRCKGSLSFFGVVRREFW